MRASTSSEVLVASPDEEEPLGPDGSQDLEAQLGGADAVEKTTYVKGHGTEPEAMSPRGPTATVPSPGAPRSVVALVLILVLLVAFVYILGIGR